jgi:hypothetical protein
MWMQDSTGTLRCIMVVHAVSAFIPVTDVNARDVLR